MMHATVVCLILLSVLLPSTAPQSTTASAGGQVCAALGPSFPKPSNLASNSAFQTALQEIEQHVDNAILTGSLPTGDANYKHTTFSLSLFNLHDPDLVWQKHYTDPSVANSTAGTHHVDADTIYQIGSISKLLTMYVLLILDGDKSFQNPVSQYLPELKELADASSAPRGALPDWDAITIEDLGTHIAGIAEDYGLDDLEFGRYKKPSQPPGYPPLPSDRLPTCNYGDNRRYVSCTTKQLVDGLATEPAIWSYSITPSYANAGYDLVGATIESIAGVPLNQTFNDIFVKPLNLTHTFYYPPNDTSFAAIPISLWHSGYVVPEGATIPDGAYFSSSNDFAKIGKSILNSTLLSVPLTRRWMKPKTFTSNPYQFAGTPWEIFRRDTPTRLWDLYTKEGEVGTYATLFGLIPDLDLGFTVLTASTIERAGANENLANTINLYALPAAQEVARQQAETNFGGRWTTDQLNTSITFATDSQPALKVTEWISNGTNLLKGDGGIDYRIWPNLLYNDTRVGFSLSMEPLIKSYRNFPLNEQCNTWGDLGSYQYGNVPMGSMVFTVDERTGMGQSLTLEAFNITLMRAQAVVDRQSII